MDFVDFNKYTFRHEVKRFAIKTNSGNAVDECDDSEHGRLTRPLPGLADSWRLNFGSHDVRESAVSPGDFKSQKTVSCYHGRMTDEQ